MPEGHPTLNRRSRYGTAVAVSLAFLTLRLALQPWLGEWIPLQMLILAIVLAAGFGGLGPGLLATAITAACGQWLFVKSTHSFSLTEPADAIRFASFLINGTAISIVAEGMHRAIGRAERQREALRDAEELARRQLAEIESIYQHAPVGLCVFDADLRFLRINEMLAGTNGIPAAEHVGRRLRDVLPKLAAAAEPTLRGVVATGEPVLGFTLKGQTPARPGVERTWIESCLPVKDDQGRVVAINVVAEEVTERLAAEATRRATEERFRALVLASSNVVWTMDHAWRSDGAVRAWWKDFTGRDDPEPNGTDLPWLEALHPDDRTIVGVLWQATQSEVRPHSAEFRLCGRAGEYRWFYGKMVPRQDDSGNLVEWVCTLRDVTARKTAEAALRESEARFRAMFELASVGMSEVDYDSGRLVRFNERFREISGYSQEALQNLHIRDLTHPDDREADWAIYVAAAAGDRPQYRNEKRYLRPDGAVVWVRVNAVFLRDLQGRFLHSMAVVEDVTERKLAEAALQESERHYRLLFETMLQGVVYQDTEGRIVSMNLAAENILGQTREQLAGQTSQSVDHQTLDHLGERLAREDHPSMVALRTGCGVKDVLVQVFNPRQGRYRWIEVTAVPIFHPDTNQPRQVYSLFDDVTEKRRGEEALRRSHEEIRRALAAAEAGSRAKDEFLATLSHELRTPLSPVLLLAGEGVDNPEFPEEARRDFRTICKNVKLEARLIDDLLDLTRITQGKLALEMQPLDLHTVIRDALETVQGEVSARKQQVTLDLTAEPHEVVGDGVRLQQACWNLLRNAVKFTPEHGTIHLATISRGDHIQFSVTDTGHGLTPQEVETVFEAFSQGDHAAGGSSRQFGGLGLGLTITRLLAQAHHGSVRAESEGRGRGARFTLSLPLRPAARPPTADLFPIGQVCSGVESEGAVPNSLAVGSGGPGLRILLVEDHQATCETLARILTRRGHQVVAVSTVAGAQAAVATNRFQVLISDIGLPDGDGCGLISDLRAQQPGLVGMAISGYGTEHDLRRSHAAGFALHLTKPIDVAALDRALSQLTTSQRPPQDAC